MYVLQERIQNFRFKVSLFFHVYVSIYFLLILNFLKYRHVLLSISPCVIEKDLREISMYSSIISEQ